MPFSVGIMSDSFPSSSLQLRKQCVSLLALNLAEMQVARETDEQILHLIKSRGPQTTAAVAGRLGITSVGARQHLERLTREGLLGSEDRAGSVGRPKRHWHLSAAGHARFPDTHSVLTLELIDGVREVFGEAGLDKLIATRETQTLAQYKARLRGARSLRARVKRLAAERDREGYMAEARAEDDGSYLLLENHCPICAAATACQGFCRSELEIFRAALGEGVQVERVEHILDGARRCAYRISEERSA